METEIVHFFYIRKKKKFIKNKMKRGYKYSVGTIPKKIYTSSNFRYA